MIICIFHQLSQWNTFNAEKQPLIAVIEHDVTLNVLVNWSILTLSGRSRDKAVDFLARERALPPVYENCKVVVSLLVYFALLFLFEVRAKLGEMLGNVQKSFLA